MARFQAERWKLHPDKDCRELVAFVSDTDEGRANQHAIKYVETLQKQGYALELVEDDGVHATKNGETFVVTVEKRER